MNRENKFLMGTGTETVGYVVNGDSDDWMYGEQGEKAKIYAYTPEVGPSFWPPKVDIDYLNRSCVWMNLATALVTLSYYEANEIVKQNFLTSTQKSITVKVSRAGLKDGVANVILSSNTNGVAVTNPLRSVELDQSESIELVYNVTIDTLLSYDNGISFTLRVDNDGVFTDKIISKDWIEGKFINIYTDSLKSASNFTSNIWELTEEEYYTPNFSMTDSKVGDYLRNTSVETLINKTINLVDCDHAFLSFHAKWDIEQGYDYVQVLASKDNSDYIPLCGIYTKSGTQDQSFNNPVYDGVQLEWVKEVIDLRDYLGAEQVWIKFILVSDNGVEKDGFYFDDIEVNVVKKPVISDTKDGIAITIYPSVIAGQNECYVKGMEAGSFMKYKITDIQGNVVFQNVVNDNKIDLSQAKVSGSYFIELWNDTKSLGVFKVTVIR